MNPEEFGKVANMFAAMPDGPPDNLTDEILYRVKAATRIDRGYKIHWTFQWERFTTTREVVYDSADLIESNIGEWYMFVLPHEAYPWTHLKVNWDDVEIIRVEYPFNSGDLLKTRRKLDFVRMT